ncbi:MAG: hypothetical protein ISS25_00130 [Nanoarchaeota archaeon]|nr:hypothetical protein [DPANN group archaeon]MBL7116226.1 hypothetical protein [Nanoarchaeota archaeon]
MKKSKKKSKVLFGGITVLALVILFGFAAIIKNNSQTIDFSSLDNFNGEMKIFKSMYCGCCGLYVDYVKKKTDLKVEIIEIDEVTPKKDEYKIPDNLRSCHTAVIGNYFVEGHIPVEAIFKLMAEQPDIAGIAMPGMPSGSPGMPGSKTEPFVIYVVNKDGTSYEFMKL